MHGCEGSRAKPRKSTKKRWVKRELNSGRSEGLIGRAKALQTRVKYVAGVRVATRLDLLLRDVPRAHGLVVASRNEGVLVKIRHA
eukprot:scaffold1130_cov195-Pinguiococcus_pyrenoidosus.AAC.55